MEGWMELCAMIVENPNILSENLIWICRDCPQPKLLRTETPRVSRSHLNAVLSVARIISRNVDTAENHGKSVVLHFLQAFHKSFHRSFWPYSFTLESISAFYCSFLGYVTCLSREFGTKVLELRWDEIMSSGDSDLDPAICRAFLVAISQNFPSIQRSDGDRLTSILLHQFTQKEVAYFEDDTIESLEKQEIAFKLITLDHILSKVNVDSRLHLHVRSIAKRHLQSSLVKNISFSCSVWRLT